MSKILQVTGASMSLALFGGAAYATDIQFDEVTAPFTPDRVTVSKSVSIDGETQKLKFDELYRTGDVDTKSGETYGLMKDHMGNPAVADPGSSDPYLCSGNIDGVRGSGTDFTALLEKHGAIYMVTQFECQNGGTYVAQLDQLPNGKLKPIAGTLQFVDNRDEWGGWVHCAGSVTPWNSFLGGEEYEPDAKKIEADETSDKYYNDKVEAYWLGDHSKSSPYHNGWITEVDIRDDGTPTYVKHYTLGRFSHELGYVMPDEKTVYLTDDGTNDVLFMFVADEAGDLSAGTLYAAKWNQTDNVGGGSADLTWINLGHATSAEIRAEIDETGDFITFSDMFTEGGTCDWIGAAGKAECLAVIPGKEKLASRLESRRYAALKGATHEFRKMEGFTYAQERGQAYIAISEVGRGMLDNEKDPEDVADAIAGSDPVTDELDYDVLTDGGPVVTGNHIQVAQADYCGAIYSMTIEGGVSDTDGNSIASSLVATDMNTILHSEGAAGSGQDPKACARSNDDLMAQPDNIAMIPGSNALIIGEDGKHINNMVWSYNLDTGDLTRIVTVPEGAETTSPYIHHIGGRAYMTVVAQHPDSSPANHDGDSITGVIRVKD